MPHVSSLKIFGYPLFGYFPRKLYKLKNGPQSMYLRISDKSYFCIAMFPTVRGLLCGFAEALLRLVVFFPALVRLSPTPTVWQFCIALSVLSSVLTHIVG